MTNKRDWVLVDLTHEQLVRLIKKIFKYNWSFKLSDFHWRHTWYFVADSCADETEKGTWYYVDHQAFMQDKEFIDDDYYSVDDVVDFIEHYTEGNKLERLWSLNII